MTLQLFLFQCEPFLVSIICVRHRPDSASLVTVFPSLSPDCWASLASWRLRVWQNLSAGNAAELSAVSGVVSQVTAVLPTLQFRTLQPEEFYREHLEARERPDGRGLLERRPVTISRGHLGTADKSAVVKCGQTSVVCGIRAELTSPHAYRPLTGFIVPNFSFSMASLAPSSSLNLTPRISQFLLTVLSTPGCVDLSDLCVEA